MAIKRRIQADDTALGKNHFKKVHEDARFLSNPQFHLRRRADGWNIFHNPNATNATMVDGKPLHDPLPVREGMVVAVGNPEKGITKFPLTLKLFFMSPGAFAEGEEIRRQITEGIVDLPDSSPFALCAD